MLGLLGMATRAGAVVPGTERVREAARAGTLRLALVARDASENSRGKLLPLLAARGISHVIRYERDELGAATGRGPLGAVGIIDSALADRLMKLMSDSEDATADRSDGGNVAGGSGGVGGRVAGRGGDESGNTGV